MGISVRVATVLALVAITALATGCPAPQDPNYGGGGPNPYPDPIYVPPDAAVPPGGGGDGIATAATLPPDPPPISAIDPKQLGDLQDRFADFVFDGGQIDFEMYRQGTHIVQIARNRYIVPVVIKWQVTPTTNVRGVSELAGSTVLPAATRPNGAGAWVQIAALEQIDPTTGYQRSFQFRGRFGDPTARPAEYSYELPFTAGSAFTVLQGFHGAFSHRGSNEYAVDFACPVATKVLAAREGVVIASNGSAVGSGNTPDFLDYKKVNFILVQHPDGTLGEYMHLAPSGVLVKPGDRVARGQPIAISGNTGYSTTPHLHFQVMTAGPDGISARSFPFSFAVTKDTVEQPVLGRSYTAWE